MIVAVVSLTIALAVVTGLFVYRKKHKVKGKSQTVLTKNDHFVEMLFIFSLTMGTTNSNTTSNNIIPMINGRAKEFCFIRSVTQPSNGIRIMTLPWIASVVTPLPVFQIV